MALSVCCPRELFNKSSS